MCVPYSLSEFSWKRPVCNCVTVPKMCYETTFFSCYVNEEKKKVQCERTIFRLSNEATDFLGFLLFFMVFPKALKQCNWANVAVLFREKEIESTRHTPFVNETFSMFLNYITYQFIVCLPVYYSRNVTIFFVSSSEFLLLHSFCEQHWSFCCCSNSYCVTDGYVIIGNSW
jgi:hypothetical protein